MTETFTTRQTNDWLEQLRRRFVAVARRRVPEDHVEDLVQEALSIVYQRGIVDGRAEWIEGRPGLAWCFQVLRNTIGNFYQKQRTRSREPEADDQPLAPAELTPFEALESSESTRAVLVALDEMDAGEGPCSRYLRRLVDGQTPAGLAAEEALDPAVLYRRLYRCRAKLRGILERRGFTV